MDSNKLKGAIYGAVLGDIYGIKYKDVSSQYINKELIFNKEKLLFSHNIENMFLIIQNLLETNTLQDFNNKSKKSMQKKLLIPFSLGKTTLKSILKSFFTKKSGIKSNKNGALIRTSVLGLVLSDRTIEKYVKSNVVLTHNDEQSISTCMINVKLINHLLKNKYDKEEVLKIIYSEEKNWNKFYKLMLNSLEKDISVFDFSKLLQKEIKNYYKNTIYTLIISIYTFIRNPYDFKKGLIEIIECGGDTSGNCLIYGIISGVSNGYNEIDNNLLNKILNSKLNLKLTNVVNSILNNELYYKYDFVNYFIRNFLIINNSIIKKVKINYNCLFNIKF